MRVDLHCHTTASDGSLEPAALYRRAAEQGVQMLAITDHDTTAGFERLLAGERPVAGPALVSGIEYSCVWHKRTVHIVGLAIAPDDDATRAAVARQSAARQRRAQIIGERLARKGFAGIYESALELAGDSQIGRPHFARAMVASGRLAREEDAFEHYLGAGKLGDVKTEWPSLEDVVSWIRAAGGIAVLAHPLKYKLSNRQLRLLLREFKATGGGALEVVSGMQPPDRTAYLAQLAAQNGLLASEGSDFHAPGSFWRELGQASRLPGNCRPLSSALEAYAV